MAKIGLVTSDRSVSLQKVTYDIKDVLEYHREDVKRVILSPNLDPYLYIDLDVVIVVMTFDPIWCKGYFLIAWNMRNRGDVGLVYTTTEGIPIRHEGDKWIYRDLDFIANSRFTKRMLEKVGARVKTIIYHGIDVKKYYNLDYFGKVMRKKLGFSENDFIALYIAGAYLRKGHDMYAEVIKYVQQKDKDIKFVILTQEDASKYYEGLENAYVLTDFGKLDEMTIISLYHMCNLYVHPALSEGFGLPVLEALACGKPVVHADYEPLSEITSPRTSFRVPVLGTTTATEVGGIIYTLHIYDPQEFGDMIIQAKESILKEKEDYKMLCYARARKFDRLETYKKFIKLIYWG